MSVDTDTILKNANLNTSMASEEVVPLGKNSLSIPQPLPENVQITESYLQQFKQTQNFRVYKVTRDFHPLEKRHLKVTSGEMVSGFAEEGGWICAFKEVSPNHFGFIPKSYLQFERQTNS